MALVQLVDFLQVDLLDETFVAFITEYLIHILTLVTLNVKSCWWCGFSTQPHTIVTSQQQPLLQQVL
jgi:hypothetical protein